MKNNKKNIKKEVGNLPINSSITLDYKGRSNNPRVSFEYPSPKYQLKSLKFNDLIFLPSFVISIVLVYLFALAVNYESFDKVGFPSNCSSTYNERELQVDCSYSKGSNISQTYSFSDDIWLLERVLEKEFDYMEVLYPFSLLMMIFIFTVAFIGFFSMFIKKNPTAQAVWPEVNKKLYDKKYSKEITSLDSKTFEIPLFKNIYLDYIAEGDFERYLRKVEIKPHDFKYRKNKKEIIDNFILWKAVFYFDEVPKEGSLKLWWT